MNNIQNIPFLLQQIEGKLNSLHIEQDKLSNPALFDIQITKKEISRIENEIDPIKKELISYTDIHRQKELMRIRLTEYMDVLGRNHDLPFSKSQGRIGELNFYLKPLVDIKSILNNDLTTRVSVNLTMTKDPSDAVPNVEAFRETLFQQRHSIIQANNMFQLFEVCRNFLEKIKINYK
ncbi:MULTISPECIES: hypothetical protein [Chryseobacterium]|uniref:Uncharacterized protein n=1 Tax=Chryseobacterium aquaticum subsp. greenlandense TaxID=345663 RepID=A0A124F3L5_9FLAO|nr:MULTISPECIES: hypothetical protein [Chryseobacterium]KNB61186.1 hypothetical protein AC804_11425 [Chryseobacterium sp. Hurlbut01]KUJ58331.1 hypothetical protein AR686_00560 [Chryseobacterium aquaticum subsp. greenlandense]